MLGPLHIADLEQDCQPPPTGWSLKRRLGWTWRRNPNYRHGKISRKRRRLEHRVASAYRWIPQYFAQLRPCDYAPLRKHSLARLGFWVGRELYLPRNQWRAATLFLKMIVIAKVWLGQVLRQRAQGIAQPVINVFLMIWEATKRPRPPAWVFQPRPKVHDPPTQPRTLLDIAVAQGMVKVEQHPGFTLDAAPPLIRPMRRWTKSLIRGLR
jgi:hypothetical protein